LGFGAGNRFRQVLFHIFQMAPGPINPPATGAAAKRIVQPVYKIRHRPLNFFLDSELKFLVAPETPGKIALRFGLHPKPVQDLPGLLPWVLSIHRENSDPRLFLSDPSAARQQDPSFGFGLTGSSRDSSLSPVRNIQTQEAELFGQLSDGPISHEFHFIPILFLFARPVKIFQGTR
jgi:hypothetical protein